MNRPAQAGDRPAAWVGPALVPVLLTLGTLVVVPILVQSRVDTLRMEIEAAEPARTLVARLRYNLVREMAALSELLLTGDQNQAASYAEAAAAERMIYDELLPLARDGAGAGATFVLALPLLNETGADGGSRPERRTPDP